MDLPWLIASDKFVKNVKNNFAKVAEFVSSYKVQTIKTVLPTYGEKPVFVVTPFELIKIMIALGYKVTDGSFLDVQSLFIYCAGYHGRKSAVW